MKIYEEGGDLISFHHIEDFIFIFYSPSLEIREGAIDRLVNLYKKSVYKTGVSTATHCYTIQGAIGKSGQLIIFQ